MQDFFEKMRRSVASLQAGLCCCRQCVDDRDEVHFCGTACPDCGERWCPKQVDHREPCQRPAEAAGAIALPGDPAEPPPSPA